MRGDRGGGGCRGRCTDGDGDRDCGAGCTYGDWDGGGGGAYTDGDVGRNGEAVRLGDEDGDADEQRHREED